MLVREYLVKIKLEHKLELIFIEVSKNPVIMEELFALIIKRLNALKELKKELLSFTIRYGISGLANERSELQNISNYFQIRAREDKFQTKKENQLLETLFGTKNFETEQIM